MLFLLSCVISGWLGEVLHTLCESVDALTRYTTALQQEVNSYVFGSVGQTPSLGRALQCVGMCFDWSYLVTNAPTTAHWQALLMLWRYLKPLLLHTHWPDFAHVARVWPSERDLVKQYRLLAARVRAAARGRADWFQCRAWIVEPCKFPAMACAVVAAVVLGIPCKRRHIAARDNCVQSVAGLRRQLEIIILSFAFPSQGQGSAFDVAPTGCALLGHGRGYRTRRYGRKERWRFSGGALGSLSFNASCSLRASWRG